MAKSKKNTWDVYVWVGCGDVKILLSNVSLKEAKAAKAKWEKKSPKHEALIAAHADKDLLKGLLKSEKPKSKAKPKDKAKDKAKGKDKAKDKAKTKKKSSK